ncbi:MAG: STAS domain-containing protein [Clostridia bacterium]|nr:STAS domain-containing protein [Clostridia bacterium]
METGPGQVTVYLSGELDHHAARPLREQIDGIAERCGAKKLRLDFEGVPFMDSSGIGLIMGRYRMMCALGGELQVTGMSERLRSIMRLGGLERLPIFPQQKGEHNETDQ